MKRERERERDGKREREMERERERWRDTQTEAGDDWECQEKRHGLVCFYSYDLEAGVSTEP